MGTSSSGKASIAERMRSYVISRNLRSTLASAGSADRSSRSVRHFSSLVLKDGSAPGVIRKSVMNMAKRGGGERHMCGVLFIHWRRLDELPQGQPEFALKVRSGRKAPARRHDRRLPEVSGDGKFPSEALGDVVLRAHHDPGDDFEAPPEERRYALNCVEAPPRPARHRSDQPPCLLPPLPATRARFAR
jgi:hypothetical protein